MGKKSKKPSDDKEEAVKSLSSTDNPFSRKRKLDEAYGDAGDSSQPPKKLWFGIDSRESKISDIEHFDGKKRKRDWRILSPDEESIPSKRRKLVEEVKVVMSKKKMKRKRDEVESEYERRKLCLVREDEPMATVVAVGEKRKADAAATDMFDTKESFDDESKLLRTVFVGNLPLKTRGKAIKREFARFGEIESVRIRSVPIMDTKVSRKAAAFNGERNEELDSMNAYVVFKEEQSAHAALSNNMTQVGGNHIRVDMACPPRKKMRGSSALRLKENSFCGQTSF